MGTQAVRFLQALTANAVRPAQVPAIFASVLQGSAAKPLLNSQLACCMSLQAQVGPTGSSTQAFYSPQPHWERSQAEVGLHCG